jgi:hypothetical protein
MDEAERAQLIALTMQEQMARLSWTKVAFDDTRAIGLPSLLATAVAHSPWHAERLEGLDVDTVGMADLAELPVMTKADLMGSFDRIVTAPDLNLARLEDHVSRAGTAAELVNDEYLVLASGGSSGRRAVCLPRWPTTTPRLARASRGNRLAPLRHEGVLQRLVDKVGTAHRCADEASTTGYRDGRAR